MKNYNKKNIIIFGLGNSGRSVLKYYYKKKIYVIAWDDNLFTRNKIKKEFPKIQINNLKNINWKNINIVIVAPGISLKHPLLSNSYKYNVRILRDLEIFTENVDENKVIAVTGTNGKSTTVSLIGEMINLKEKNIFVGGNIDPPLIDSLKTRSYDKYIVELSSFQLESAPSFKSHISVLLNISEDHLERYSNVNNYSLIKKKIFHNLKSNQYAIIGIDDSKSNLIYKEIKKLSNKVIPISINRNSSKGVSVVKGKIIDNYFQNPSLNLLNIKLNIETENNLQNILATYVVAKILGYSNNLFLKAIKKFKGLKHRAQIIYQKNNLVIVNDSKATNLSAAIKSINSYKNIHLIMGGRLKNRDYSELIGLKNNICKIYLIGESSNYIKEKIKNIIKYETCSVLKTAFAKSVDEIKNNNNNSATILLAPACSSFDQYKNFEQRGDEFINLTRKFISAKLI